jgi:heat shock protein HslJ
MKKVVFVALSIGLLMCGCKSQKSLTSYANLNGEWAVIELTGHTFNADVKKPSLKFDVAENRVSGNAGCNQIVGTVKQDEAKSGALTFSGIAATRKACIDMSAEDAFLKALNQVSSFKVEKPNEATFYGPNNQKLFVINK